MTEVVKCSKCISNFKKFAICDSCLNTYCKNCSELTLREFNIAALEARKLKFICQSCNVLSPQVKSQSDIFPETLDLVKSQSDIFSETLDISENLNNQNEHHISLDVFQRELSKLTEIILSTKQEVSDLKDSNIDLIKLITSEEYLKLCANQHLKQDSLKNTNYFPRTAQIRNEINGFMEYINLSSKTTNTISNFNSGNHLKDQNDKNSNQFFDNICRSQSDKNSTSKKLSGPKHWEEGRKYIKGSWGSKETNLIKSSKFWIFTSGYDTSTTTKEITDYLNQFQKTEIICEKINTRNKNTSSFKIGVPYQYKDNFMSSDIWPVGIYVNKYFAPRNCISKENNRTHDFNTANGDNCNSFNNFSISKN